MNAFTRMPLQPQLPSSQGGVIGRFLAGVVGAVATAVAVFVGAILAVFAAAAVAILAVLGAVAVFLTGVVLKNRLKRNRRTRTSDAGDDGIIEARKVGHAWVAYGWDQPSR